MTPAAGPAPAALCPLCGQGNQCAIAAGRPAHSCWCMARVITPEALAAVPASQRGQVCICPACGRAEPGAGTAPAAPAAPI